MRLFKFGGASIKDAAGVHNLYHIVQNHRDQQLGVVVSAMGKTTNALELVLHHYLNNDPYSIQLIDQLAQQHLQLITDLELMEDDGVGLGSRFRESGITTSTTALIQSLKHFLNTTQITDADQLYDTVVSYGELLSTTIVSAYLNSRGCSYRWMDARELIITDTSYRSAVVDWEATATRVGAAVGVGNFITQGFIASDGRGHTTTLGREGSDYSAAIVAYILKAESVTIWKDVAGVLNADPRIFDHTQLLQEIPYSEAVEMAFYGATVIHPKTLQPLQEKKIPLHVKSFLEPHSTGSTVADYNALLPAVPCYIIRNDMYLLQVTARDFSFIGEANIAQIFSGLNKYQIQTGLLQNSAISFALCIEDKYNKLAALLVDLTQRYSITVYSNVSLYTIRHYDMGGELPTKDLGRLLLRQLSQNTLQMVYQA